LIQRDAQLVTSSQGCAQKGNRAERLWRITTSVNRPLYTSLPLKDRSWSSSLCKGLLCQLVYQHPRMQKVSLHISTWQSCTSSLKAILGPSLVMSAMLCEATFFSQTSIDSVICAFVVSFVHGIYRLLRPMTAEPID